MRAWEKWSSSGNCENDHPFPHLRNLTLRECPKLKIGLPERLDSATLHIEGCPRFKSFQDEYGGEQMPQKLKKLVIKDCEDIERVTDDLTGLTSLNEVTVSRCHKLSSFPSVGLPPALSRVEIKNCPSLSTSQFRSMRLLESLKELTQWNLEGLMSIENVITGTRLSQSLRNLSICYCRSLTTIPDSLQHLSALSRLLVEDCEALELDCFPGLPCNLVVFVLRSCPKVKSLPQDMHNLTSLKRLKIYSCDGIKCLPSGGLPPNLESLEVGGCRMMKQPLEEWGLAGLTSLREFKIGGEMGCVDEMVSFPSSVDAWRRLLPSSLVILSICGMKKVERLSRGLRADLSSLQVLHIIDCEKMRKLSEEGLPDSLELLKIRRSERNARNQMEITGNSSLVFIFNVTPLSTGRSIVTNSPQICH